MTAMSGPPAGERPEPPNPPTGSGGSDGNGKDKARHTDGSLLRIVWFLLAVTGVFIGSVAVHTVRASHDTEVRAGLDYEVFLRALDDLVVGAGDSALVRFDQIRETLPGGRRVDYDTIVVIADVEAYPAFDRAGFLHDQAQAYNRFQRDRVTLARLDPEWFDRLRSYNPSVFRTYRRVDGSPGLTRSPAAWGLRVRSPLEGDWNGEIRAQDVHRGQGLIGPRVAVSLRRPVSLVRIVDGRRQLCEFDPESLEVQAYCLSEERIPQAIFRLASEERPQSRAVAGWTDLWVDGSRIRSGDSIQIQGGTVLRINPLEPVVFAEYWEGVLSSKQWVNGRMRRRGEFEQPLDLFSTLGALSAVDGDGISPTASIDLSVNAEASADLTARLNDFVEREIELPLDFGMLVLARVPDGEIVAIAEVGQRRYRGRSSLLERVAPGSAVKPLLAAAILSQRPDLASLEIPARSGSVRSVLGMPNVSNRRAFSSALNCGVPQDGWLDLRYFLRCSNNEYAASLMVAGLTESREWVSPGRWSGGARPQLPLVDGQVPRSALLRSPLSEGLSELFDVPVDPIIADSMGRSRRVWEGLTFSDGRPVRVPYELLPTESRPALLAPGSPDGTDLGLLYRYAYGAWENQWTLTDLTTGFARIVTDRRIQLTFVRDRAAILQPGQLQVTVPDSTQAEPLGLGDHDWYATLMSGLRDVAVDGTARTLRSSWRRNDLPASVLAKTGTLTEPGEPGPADDLYAKSLLFAVGERSDAPGGPLECGMVGGIYLRFVEGPRSGSLPSYQVEFARLRLGAFLKEYWEEFGACADRSRTGS